MPFRLGWRRSRGAIDVLFLAPLTLYILGLTLWPVLSTIALSFQDRRTGSFPTLANYQAVVEHFEFWDAVYNPCLSRSWGSVWSSAWGSRWRCVSASPSGVGASPGR